MLGRPTSAGRVRQPSPRAHTFQVGTGLAAAAAQYRRTTPPLRIQGIFDSSSPQPEQNCAHRHGVSNPFEKKKNQQCGSWNQEKKKEA